MRILIFAALIMALALPAMTQDMTSELIFPFNPKHNHGSSIVETPEGDLLACWFHGSGERTADDVLVQGARKRAGEDTWSAPFVMADTQDLPDCNPVLFVDPRGTLWLFWIAVQDNQWGGSLLKYRTATDYAGDGPPNWDWQDVIHTRPQELETRFLALIETAAEQLGPLLSAVEGFEDMVTMVTAAAKDKLSRRLGWMTRNHPIMVNDKRMVLGLYSDVFNCSVAAITEDWGETWTTSYPILSPRLNELSNIQPCFVQRKNGDIVAYMRDNGIPKRIRTAVSKDLGMTWDDYGMLDIRNPGSSVEVIALESGAWLLICNDTHSGRHKVTLYLSEDEGATWPIRRALEDFEPDAGTGSYFSIIQAKDGTIHTTYSFKTQEQEGSTIKHVRFDEAWVRAEE
jgi:predicted neuraminidase